MGHHRAARSAAALGELDHGQTGEHGVAGLVNLYGIESPGLTSSLAIADKVAERLGFT